MIFVINDSRDAFFNMAAEEYFLTQCTEDVFMLWQNVNAIIVGKNQNTLAEIDSEYVKQNNITVVRRLTGGGAMYHDLGNINFTFITKSGEWFSNFAYFVKPVIQALKQLGVPAELSGRNDILVDGRKISGNAQTVKNERIMHHGTLLFNADLSVLSRALRPDPEKINAKGIASVASRVANINEFLDHNVTAQEIIDAIRQSVLELYANTIDYTMTNVDVAQISSLADTKYRSWDWNYGYSPRYSYCNKKKFKSGMITVKLMVRRGIIEEATIEGDFLGLLDVAEISTALRGVAHHKVAMFEALQSFKLEDYIMGVSLNELIDLMSL